MEGDLDLAEQLELQSSDDEQQPAVHNKLLGAISQLYEKKRVKAPTRKEPSLEVSEFHLGQPDKKQGRIKVTELAKALNKRAIHADISHKLKIARKRAKTLPKPLEKFHADQITRAAGYEHAKRQLNRWDAVVYKHKVAEQLQFPLSSDTITVHQHTSDVSKLFRKPTELELKLAEILKEPDPTVPEKQEEETKNEVNEEYPLTLAEIIEKRKMMAKLRAQQSYKQLKAARHSKIKSKKFHQIQRRARVKEQLREFEELQKKDPEAALKKLEELERTRAEERVTLRHRSTGQWAKNLAVRAKYDKEARIALAEQLSKSRELTVKLVKDNESESEKEEEAEVLNPEPTEQDPSNPWVIKRSKDMEEFISGYRKYWETKGKEKEKITADTAVKINNVQDDSKTNKNDSKASESPDKENSESKFTGSVVESNEVAIKDKQNKNSLINDKVSTKNVFNVEKSPGRNVKGEVTNKHNLNLDNSVIGENNECRDSSSIMDNKSVKNTFNVSDSCSSRANADSSLKSRSKISVERNTPSNNSLANKSIPVKSNVGAFILTDTSMKNKTKQVTSVKSSFKITNANVNSNIKKKSNKITQKEQAAIDSVKLNNKIGSWVIENSLNSSNSISSKKLNGFKDMPRKIKNRTDTNTLKESNDKQTSETLIKETTTKEKSIDELFEEMEDKLEDKINSLRDKIQKKSEKLKDYLNSKRKYEEDSGVESESEEMPSLELKKKKVSADVDEELLEQSNAVDSGKDKDTISKTLTTASSAVVKTTDDIDPKKFLKVTSRQLITQLPDVMTEGDDVLDDEDNAAQDRHLTISEAFAEDDVVDQFQQEKDEEAKKSNVGDIDLTLPGWGSWAGHNMKDAPRRKRKKFVIKFPKALPRRDSNRGNVIINEDADKPIKEHQVTDIPYPFTSVKEYEASIRAPLGSTWVPQTAHVKLTAPPVVTRLGTIIQPMNESQLVSKDKTLPTNTLKKKNKNKDVNKK